MSRHGFALTRLIDSNIDDARLSIMSDQRDARTSAGQNRGIEWHVYMLTHDSASSECGVGLVWFVSTPPFGVGRLRRVREMCDRRLE